MALRHPTDFSSMRPMWVLGKHPYIPSFLGEHTDLISALLFVHLDLSISQVGVRAQPVLWFLGGIY